VKDAGVIIGWLGNPCSCRCRHCSIMNRGRTTAVPLERAEAIAERFLQWKAASGREDFYVSLGVGYSYDFPLYLEYLRFSREHDLPVYGFLPNGIALRNDAQLAQMFQTLKAAGISSVTTSFFGIGESHDRFTGRRGDFDFMMRVARAASACGLDRAEAIYLRKATLRDVPQLLSMLDEIPGRTVRQMEPSAYRGRAKRQEHDRPLAAEVRRLPESVQRQINWERYKSEAEWVAQVLAGDIPPRVTRYAIIPVSEDTVDMLESADCQALVGGIFEAHDRFLQALPTLEDLARRYGKPHGRRLYALRDLEWKWPDRFLAEHPEVDGTWAFDESRTTVMVHRSTHDAVAAA